MATACDWLPTIAELCGIPLPEHRLDGHSLVDVIRSPEAVTPHQVFHWQTGNRRDPQWAVRQGDWELIGNPRDTSGKRKLTEEDRLFLVNLKHDVSEMTNVAGEHREVVQRLRAMHEDWASGFQTDETTGGPEAP